MGPAFCPCLGASKTNIWPAGGQGGSGPGLAAPGSQGRERPNHSSGPRRRGLQGGAAEAALPGRGGQGSGLSFSGAVDSSPTFFMMGAIYKKTPVESRGSATTPSWGFSRIRKTGRGPSAESAGNAARLLALLLSRRGSRGQERTGGSPHSPTNGGGGGPGDGATGHWPEQRAFKTGFYLMGAGKKPKKLFRPAKGGEPRPASHRAGRACFKGAEIPVDEGSTRNVKKTKGARKLTRARDRPGLRAGPKPEGRCYVFYPPAAIGASKKLSHGSCFLRPGQGWFQGRFSRPLFGVFTQNARDHRSDGPPGPDGAAIGATFRGKNRVLRTRSHLQGKKPVKK